MEVRNKIVEIVSEFLKISPEQLTDATVAADVPGWDSLSHAEILLEIEEKLNVNFDLNDLVTISNFGDLVLCVSKKITC